MKTDYEAALPHSIVAVFCVRDWECADARDVRDRFVAAYPDERSAEDVPLLHYGYEAGFAEIP